MGDFDDEATRIMGEAFDDEATRIMGEAFDDEATRVMGEAFDAACQELYHKGQPTVVYEFIAKRILAAARKGERDAERLRDIGLARRTR
jgi:hypothetical protein